MLRFIVTLIVAYLAHAEPRYKYDICYEGLTFSNNSQYGRNLYSTLSILPTTNNGFGFFTHFIGEGDNIAHATALCRGGVDPDMCQSCLSDSILKAREKCPNKMGAVFYYDECTLSYYNKHLGSNLHIVFTESQTISDSRVFKARVMLLLTNLIKIAASGSVLQKFASGNTSSASNSTTIYGLVQCNPDLSREGCTQCLDGAINLFYVWDGNSNGTVGGRVFQPICNFWYDIKPYYNEGSDHTRSPPPPPPPTGQGKNNTAILVVVIVTICVIIIIASICIFFRIRKKNENIQELTPHRITRYDFNLIKLATNEFSDDAKLGQGGFGTVYQGNLEGKDIAVKKLHKSSGGEEEFKNEVIILGSIAHRNLVRLLGYSIEGSERLLVFEYLPKGSLDRFISDSSKREQLDWEKRFNILTGIANGLVYLHRYCHPPIIHRDMKPANILLDEKLNAKIADFGLATFFNPGEIERDTTHVVGTHGYMPPEYVTRGHISEKTDVYSFGVLMLEIIGGQLRRNQCYSNGESIISYAWRHWQNGTVNDVIDPFILMMGHGALHQVSMCINVGLLCVQENDGARPTSKEVANMMDNSGNPNHTVPSPVNPFSNVHVPSSTNSSYYTLTN